MDIRSLSCFIAVAEELHFHRAALRLHLTQPALSQRIKVLEGEVGVDLFARDRRTVSLTAAGAAFLGPARAAIEQAGLAKRQALRASKGEVGRLRLGFTTIAFFGALPAAVRTFKSAFPDVEIELAEMNSPSVEDALVAGRLDLGVLHPPILRQGIDHTALAAQPLMLALPSGHPLCARPVVRAADLDGEPMLMAPRSIGPHFHDRLIVWFQEAGVSPRIVQEVWPMTTLTGLVAAGVGSGFVTSGVASAARPGVEFRPVDPPGPGLPFAAAWPKGQLSATARRFLGLVVSA